MIEARAGANSREAIKALNLDLFPARYCIQTRQSDQDALRHVGNYSITIILGEARTRMIRDFAPREMRPNGLVFMVGQNATTFVRQSHYPEDCFVGCGLLEIGRSSFRIAQALFQKDECKALGESVLVAVQSNSAAVICDSLRESLSSLMLPIGVIPPQLIT